MVKVLFVDDRLTEVECQWQESGCDKQHELLPLEVFDSVARTCHLVRSFRPGVVVIGHGLSKHPITGSHVIRTLREQGYTGYIIANSGGGTEQFNRDNVEVDGSADRVGQRFREVLTNLFPKRMKK